MRRSLLLLLEERQFSTMYQYAPALFHVSTYFHVHNLFLAQTSNYDKRQCG